MKRHEDGIHTDGGRELRGHRGFAAPRGETHDVAFGDAVASGDRWMNLNAGPRRSLQQFGHAAGLGAGLVVGHHASGGEVEGELGVGLFGGGAMLDGVKTGAAIGGEETIFKKSRRSGMVFVRAWPEDAVLAGDAV